MLRRQEAKEIARVEAFEFQIVRPCVRAESRDDDLSHVINLNTRNSVRKSAMIWSVVGEQSNGLYLVWEVPYRAM